MRSARTGRERDASVALLGGRLQPGPEERIQVFSFLFFFLLTNVVVYQSVGHRTQLPARFGFAGRFSTDLPE